MSSESRPAVLFLLLAHTDGLSSLSRIVCPCPRQRACLSVCLSVTQLARQTKKRRAVSRDLTLGVGMRLDSPPTGLIRSVSPSPADAPGAQDQLEVL